MIPLAIPSSSGPLFAMYGPAQGAAVLMCPPFGDEALKTARVWRDLAKRLGWQGIATLRFDLPGTGNSAGEPTDPDRVAVWRTAVKDCAAWLASRHAGRIILFGHRFGALLAIDAAMSGVAAERLVLLDPPASGAALARYYRARFRLERTDNAPGVLSGIEIGGFPISLTTLADMAGLAAAPAGGRMPDALLVLHETPSSPNPWLERFRKRESHVEVVPFEDHESFVARDAFRSKPPKTVLEHITDYLIRSIGSATPPEPVATPWPLQGLSFDGFGETPIWFGPGRRLFGILCRPEIRDRSRRALLLPTTGADPCSGMARLWTDLARRLAKQGVTSLRFDMGCVGESDGDQNGTLLSAMYDPDRVVDLSAAVDAVCDLGFEDVNVAGYCSGAYAAWHAAVPDRRIAAILAVNLLYFSIQLNLSDESLTLRPGTSLIGSQNGLVARWIPQSGIHLIRRLDASTRRFVPPRFRVWLRRWSADPRRTRRHLTALVARRCAVSLVMADGDHGHVRLRRAYGETPCLPPGAVLTVISGADHQFSDRRHRERFLSIAADFALDSFVAASVVSAPFKPVRNLEIAL